MPKSRPRAERFPFKPEIGPKMGSGQDNRVYQLVNPADKPHLRQPTGSVVKINHAKPNLRVTRHPDSREAAWRGTLYKKNKYELLKLFLGDFIPDSSFVLGEVTEGDTRRPAEYTVQKEVPRISLNHLTEQQQQDPRLIGQVTELMQRLQYMYKVLGEANARTSHGTSLDGKLDLGGVSDYVRPEDLDHIYDEHDAEYIINTNSSKNLLVDPETMQLSCIDFDQGQWTDGMTRAKETAESIVARDVARLGGVGEVAILAAADDTQQRLFRT